MATTNKIFLAFGFWILVFSHSVHAATFKISPSSAIFTQGCNYAVDVLIDTENKSSNAADILINYDSNKIDIAEVKPGTTYGDYFGNLVDASSGTIRLTGASFNTPFNGNGVFATILFKPKVTTGTSSFNIYFTGADPYNSLDSNIADTTTSNDLLSGVQNGFFSFNSGTCIADHTPPQITFLAPTNNQTNVPQNANVVVDVADPGSGVDVGLIRVAINGIVYTVKNSQVKLTGNTTKYELTIKPTQLLNSTLANTILVNATDIAGNSTQQLITFNLPGSTPLACIPTTTITSTPTPTPYIPSTTEPTPTTYLQPTITAIPTRVPTSIPQPSPTPTPIIDTQSPSINFISPVGKDTISLTPEITFNLVDPDSGIGLNSIHLNLNDQLITFDHPGFSSTGSKYSSTVTYQVKTPLLADTDYTLTVFVTDISGNGLSKSIIVHTTTPVSTRVIGFVTSVSRFYPIFIFLLFISSLIFLLSKILGLIGKNKGIPFGQIVDSTTLEPIPHFKVSVGNISTTTNIFGIFSFDLKPGQYKFKIGSTESAATDSFVKLSYTSPIAPHDDRPPQLINSFLTFLGLKDPDPGFVFSASGHLRSGLTINLIDPDTKIVVTSRITDSLGRYRFFVPNGHYLVDIPDSPSANFMVDTRNQTAGYTTINRNIFL